jgi:hypothetical protein
MQVAGAREPIHQRMDDALQDRVHFPRRGRVCKVEDRVVLAALVNRFDLRRRRAIRRRVPSVRCAPAWSPMRRLLGSA